MFAPSLTQAPQGIAQSANDPIEIEIEQQLDVGPEGLEVDLDPAAGEKQESADFDDNLVDTLEDKIIQGLSGDLTEDYDNELNSRADWEKAYADGIKLLGLRYEERTQPWEGACGAFSPILTEAVVRFQSETITETFPASGPVKTSIIGKKTPEKEAAAKRVAEDMNHELTDVMVEYRPEHEKMLWNLPIAGSAFKKVYYDPSIERQVSLFIPAEDIILPYGTSEISSCPRLTHRMRKTKNEILRLQESGFYAECDIGDPSKEVDEIQKKKDEETGFSASHDDRYLLLEMHVELCVEADKYNKMASKKIAAPYVVTILKDTGKVMSVRRNWLEEDVTMRKRQHFVHYQYIPGFGSYGFGLLHLIGSAATSATSLIRQLVDAGTLANLPGGLKARGLRIKGDDTPIAPGEFRDVDVASGTVRDNIMPLPYKEPSQTLLALLNQIVDEARRFAATADLKVSDMSAQAPVGTTLALLERMLKVMSAVQARIHYSMKQELRLLGAIIRDYTPDSYDYDVEGDEGEKAKKSDYEYTSIIPVSDPNAATMSQKIIQYQAALQLAQTAPQIYDMPRLHRQMLDVIGIPNTEKLVKLPEDQKPQDPVTENMAIMMAQPIKAFEYQDHQAHMACHQAWLQDPMIMQALGQNPAAQQMLAAVQAHIAEHAAFNYRKQIEIQLGVPLPTLDEDNNAPISEDDEKSLSSLIAMAAQRTLLQNQAQQAQMQNQQQSQNPELQLSQMELQIKQADVQRKAQKDQNDARIAGERLALERERMQNQSEQNDAKITLDHHRQSEQHGLNVKQAGVKLALDHHHKNEDRKLNAATQLQNAHNSGKQVTKEKKDGKQ